MELAIQISLFAPDQAVKTENVVQQEALRSSDWVLEDKYRH